MHPKIKNVATIIVMTVMVIAGMVIGNQTVQASYDDIVEEDANIKALTIGPGSDESELRFTWHAYTPETGKVELYEDEKRINTFLGTSEAIQDGWYTNKVTVNGLKENTVYSYRVGNGHEWSEEYEITTGNPDSFSFFVAGDPQIGIKDLASDTQKWDDTIHSALQAFPDINFMISTGDQVNSSTEEKHYDGYLSPLGLKSLPVAPVAGNHDVAVNFINHFNFPNHDNTLVNTEAGGDYWFVYGNTLFLSLNSNHKNIKQHKQFMQQAIKENPDAKFRVAIFHHSIYSVANHAFSTRILSRRGKWAPVFDELGIDFTFSGHDHSYARTYQMYNDAPVENVKMGNGSAIDPAGTVYLTANAVSGSKYYNVLGQEFYYAANFSQLFMPTIVKVDITKDQLTVKTYRLDTMEIIDEYSIIKTQVDTVNKPEELKLANSGKTSIKVSWNKEEGAKGYQVWWSKTKNGTYKKVAAVTETSFLHKNLPIGGTYYYKVRAYKKVKGEIAYSEFTDIKSLKVPVSQPANVKAVNAGAASIKVSWKKVSGASGYRVYRSNQKKGTYKKIATLSADKKSYKDKKVKNKKIYYYKVRAFNKVDGSNKYSTYTNPVKKKAVLSKPEGIKAKKAGNGKAVKISWKKAAGANQYQIYRKTGKKGKYAKIATLDAKKTSYNNKNVEKNKTYYYKVRAVQKTAKKNYLSKYSDEVSVKVK